MTTAKVDVQVIANVVVRNEAEEVLFVRYDPESDKWWLPGKDVEPFAHPDEACSAALSELGALEVGTKELSFVESFRGRRGWHLVFHYDVRAEGQPGAGPETAWFSSTALPRSAHGQWEKDAIARVAGADPTGPSCRRRRLR